MRPSAALIAALLVAATAARAYKDPRDDRRRPSPRPPVPWSMTMADGDALRQALENSDQLTQAQRDQLVALLRRASRVPGAIDQFSDEEKRALLDAAYAGAQKDANSDALSKAEKVRRLKDWVVLLDESERQAYPLLSGGPPRSRYIVGKGVGAVGADTPIPKDEPAADASRTAPGGNSPRTAPVLPSPSQVAPVLPPVPPDMAPGSVVTPNEEGGWSPAAGPPSDSGGGPSPEAAAKAQEKEMGKMGAAQAAAARAGSLGGAGAGPGGLPPGIAPPTGGATGDPSRPASASDLALAQGPYRPAFEAAGLKVENRGAAPTVVRRDGSPASPAEVSALSAEIARMPAAAARRPGYLDPDAGVSWSRFQDLKRDYEARPSLRESEFKHIGLSEDRRDFKRSESCDALSGACNPHAEASYKKGEDVPAGELDSIWKKINGYLVGVGAKKSQTGAAKAALSTGGIWARVRRAAGGGDASAAPSDDPADSADAGAGGGSGWSGGNAATAARSSGGTRVPGAPGKTPRRRPTASTSALVAAGAALLAYAATRTRWARER